MAHQVIGYTPITATMSTDSCPRLHEHHPHRENFLLHTHASIASQYGMIVHQHFSFWRSHGTPTRHRNTHCRRGLAGRCTYGTTNEFWLDVRTAPACRSHAAGACLAHGRGRILHVTGALDTARRRHKRVCTDHPTPRRVVPESPESLSQGREASRCGHHRQAGPRRTDRLLESHRAGNRAARKTQHSAAASTSPEDRGANTVSAPGGKTHARFHANDPGLTPTLVMASRCQHSCPWDVCTGP